MQEEQASHFDFESDFVNAADKWDPLFRFLSRGSNR